MKEIKSHMYIAESILKRFAFSDVDGKKKINYFDYKTNSIKKDTIKNFNTEYGYYTRSNEKVLSDKSESLIGQVIAKIEKGYNQNRTCLNINFKDLMILKKYVAYQLIKDESFIINMKKSIISSGYATPLSNEEYERRREWRFDLLTVSNQAYKNALIEIEEKRKNYLNSLKDLGIAIIINKTKENYLIISSVISDNPQDNDLFVMRISLTPKIQLAFCKKELIHFCFKTQNDYTVIEENNGNAVINYNKGLFEGAKHNKPNILVGYRQDIEKVL